jgi:hypothetical protein
MSELIISAYSLPERYIAAGPGSLSQNRPPHVVSYSSSSSRTERAIFQN